MAKMRLINGKLVPVDETPAPAPESKPKPQPEPEEKPKQTLAMVECIDCHAWVTISSEPSDPEPRCPKCKEKRAREEKMTAVAGTPFDNMVKEAIEPSRITDYSPSVQDYRRIFNQEVEGHGIHPDHEFVEAVMGHKFIKAAKDATTDELIDRIQLIDKLMFELWARRRGSKLVIDGRVAKANAEQRAKIKALDEGYKVQEVDTDEKPARAPREKKERKAKVVNKTSAIESMKLLLMMSGIPEAEVMTKMREQFPALFE